MWTETIECKCIESDEKMDFSIVGQHDQQDITTVRAIHLVTDFQYYFSSLLCFQLRSLHTTTPSELYLLVRRDYCSSCSRVASFLVLAVLVAGADGRVVLVLF